MLARGMRHEYRRQPRRDAHEEDPLRCGGVVRKKVKKEGNRERRNGDGLGEDAMSVRKGQYLREGLGSAS